MANLSKTTRDHGEIQRWAEERGGKPTHVKSTGSGGDVGILRIDFPGYSGEGSLEPITWDDWFEKFDDQNLALLYEEETAGGQTSNFNKLVSAATAAANESRSRRGGSSTSRSRSRSAGSGSKSAPRRGTKKVSGAKKAATASKRAGNASSKKTGAGTKKKASKTNSRSAGAKRSPAKKTASRSSSSRKSASKKSGSKKSSAKKRR